MLPAAGDEWTERNTVAVVLLLTPAVFDDLMAWRLDGDPEGDVECDDCVGLDEDREEDDPAEVDDHAEEDDHPGEVANEDNAGSRL